MRLVAIADTHSFHDDLVIPDGDVLVHAGDMTQYGTVEELEEFNAVEGEMEVVQEAAEAGEFDPQAEIDPENESPDPVVEEAEVPLSGDGGEEVVEEEDEIEIEEEPEPDPEEEIDEEEVAEIE